MGFFGYQVASLTSVLSVHEQVPTRTAPSPTERTGPRLMGRHGPRDPSHRYRIGPVGVPRVRLMSQEAIATTITEPMTAPTIPPQSNLSSSPMPSSSVKMK